MSAIREALRNPGHSEFLRFLVVGGFAAVVNVVSRYFISYVTGYSLAIVLAYAIGMITAFLLSKLFVFRKSGRPPAHEFTWFTIINVLALFQVWAVSIGLTDYGFPWIGMHWHAETVAHAIGVASPVVNSYFGHKHLSFRAAVPER